MIIEIKPAKDVYEWSVEYHNGVIVPEFDDERPDGRGWAEINSLQVKYVRLHQAGWPAHNVTVPDGAEPVFFRRRRIEMDTSTIEQKLSTMHCIGWKNGQSACYLFICEDGSTLLTSDFQAV